jgi:DNA-binding response OmpR family regulator
VKHILVVEDDAGIRDLLLIVLHDNGYSVATAHTGREALEAMHTRLPDLVLLDLMLPDMTGWAFLRARESERVLTEVPILVISAAGPSGIDEAQSLGAPVFLPKPFEVDELLERVQLLCASPVRQCAWCGRVMDPVSEGDFRLRSGRKLRWATHGICPECKSRERRSMLN